MTPTWKNEVAEFKQTGGDFSPDDIAMYFTALRNEANLRGADGGWLVFAVNNKTRRVVGTDYRPQHSRIGPRWWARAAVRDSRSAAEHSYCEEGPLLRPRWRKLDFAT